LGHETEKEEEKVVMSEGLGERCIKRRKGKGK